MAMESRKRSSNKRNSGIFEHEAQPLQRRTSRRSSSRDRHGHTYPETLRETSMSTVDPDPPAIAEPAESSRKTSVHSSRRGSTSKSAARAAPKGRTRIYLTDNDSVDDDTKSSSPPRTVSRPSTRTVEESTRDRSPTSTMSQARNRLGSLQSTATPDGRDATNPLASIGFPYIIASAPTTTQVPVNRQRLTKSPPRPVSPSQNGPDAVYSQGQAAPTSDTAKVLQLMKTTCGRMHGILSFRTTTGGSWSSGYCAINVATGSLIYQTKGDVSHAKTLIPDLRGCRVRTQTDSMSQMTFLEVSTHTMGLGIHLRPHVAETFDSWLAALLCWQPLPPKGVQNKMVKPHGRAVTERKHGERRRSSVASLVKDAAIIKVGKMLYWDHDMRHTKPEKAHRRISTYKQQRSSAGTSWRKVSCTLQENGQLKLFMESDTVLIAIVPLSSLSRCAIQRLDPTVLDDEFCIAIFPQYAIGGAELGITRPVYLSLESRILFEVWFVLLRAFTVPEMYGPEQSLSQPEPEPETNGIVRWGTNMFRVEKNLSLRIIEAKLHAPRALVDGTPQKLSKAGGSHGKDWVNGTYHAEVHLDGEMRARTGVKLNTSNPFWREDYNFSDLPPVLSSAIVIVKSRHPGHKDWTLISAENDYHHDDINKLGNVGDIAILPLDTTYGMVDLRLNDLERGKDTEKWWPICDELDETVGEILMKVRMDEFVVLMSQDYKEMLELLHSFSDSLTQQICAQIQVEQRRLPELLLNIYQVSGQASNWIMSLVEDEIDGFHKETPVTRFRYSRRIASNDSFDSGIEREMLLRDLNKSATVEANLLFRGNSLLTKALDFHMRRLGKEYLEETLCEKMRDIDESDPDCEVDPNRLRQPEDLQRNWRNLIALTENVWKSIAASPSRCPPELRLIFRHIRACAEDSYGDFLRTVRYSSVSGFLFLRFFCPAVLNPKLFGLLKDHARPRAQRTLTLIAKSLQTLANLTTFGNKESWMEPMNAFLTSHRTEFKEFVDAICAISSDQAISAIPPSYATPITVLGRLPPPSREGFLSLPYLLDQAREFSALVALWCENKAKMTTSNNHSPANPSSVLHRFDALCDALRLHTRNCLNQAEQAERPSGSLALKWEELIEQMDCKARISDAAPTSPRQPLHTNDIGNASPSNSSTDVPADAVSTLRRPSTARSNGTLSAQTATIRLRGDSRIALPIDNDFTPPPSSGGSGSGGGWDRRADSERDEDKRFPSHALSWGGDSGGSAEAGGGRSLASSVRSTDGGRAGSSRLGDGDSIGGRSGKAGKERTLRKRRRVVDRRGSEREREKVPDKTDGKRMADMWGFRWKGAGAGEEGAGR